MTSPRVSLACLIQIQDPRDIDILRQQRKRPHQNEWQKALDYSMNDIITDQHLAGLSSVPVVWSIHGLASWFRFLW